MKIAMYSGGKDSTAMMLMIARKRLPCDVMVFVDVGNWDYPDTLDRAHAVSKEVGVPLKVVGLQQGFTYYLKHHEYTRRDGTRAKGYGWPTIRKRWCTTIKCAAAAAAVKDLKPSTIYIGYNYAENERSHGVKSEEDGRRSYPLQDMRIDTAAALRICRRHGYFTDGEYQFHDDRVSCWCCPLQTLRSLGRMITNRPDLWARIREWSRDTPNRFYAHPLTLDELERRALKRYQNALHHRI